MSVRAWIGLGSNLDDPATQLRRALTALACLPQTRLVAVSRAWRNPPLLQPGQAAQPDYLNAVAGLDTGLEPLALLDALQAIETTQGRVRGERWGARPLDLDLLLYGEHAIELPRLVVPHPGLATRRFVLQPLAEIAPGLRLPDGRAIADLLTACPGDALGEAVILA